VTVLGSTRNIVATSAGVNSGSASGVRADMCVASPPGPVLRSCILVCLVPRVERVGDVQVWPDRYHIAITNGDTSTTRRKVSVPEGPATPPIAITQSEFSNTYHRSAPDSEISEITVRQVLAGLPS
jgi:hypothetical protein